MVLSKRERYIAIATAAAVACFAADRLVLTPLKDMRNNSENRRLALLAQVSDQRNAIKLSQELAPRWKQLVEAGMKRDPGEVETQMFRAIGDWERASGVTHLLTKSDRPSDKTVLPEVNFQVNGTGTMESVENLLWLIQSATVPVRLTQVDLSAKKEGTNELSFQLRLSSVYLPGQAGAAERPGGEASRPSGGGR
jgi:hypothetical protein